MMGEQMLCVERMPFSYRVIQPHSVSERKDMTVVRYDRMIMRLQGTVLDHGLDWVLLDVGGVGYQVHAPLALVASQVAGTVVTIWTHEVVREDKRELYGFASREALELFWKLIEVNGVGPKVAQKILGSGTPEEVKRHVMEGDITFLTRVPGVGKKTAQKIILELKGALVDLATLTGDRDLVEVLTGLGYAVSEARLLASRVPSGLETIEEKVKAALQTMV